MAITLTQAVADEWQFIDGLEVVTYFVRLTEGTFVTPATTIPNCLPREVSREWMASVGLLDKTGKVWHLWASQASGVVPKEQDVVQDGAGVRWAVKRVQKQTLGTRYRLTCIKER